MKFTEKQFKKFIINEAKKLIENENNFSFKLKDEEKNEELNECDCENQDEHQPSLIFISSDEFEDVNPEEFQEDAGEAKQLSEELSRMKELLSFNNPLLKL